MFFCINAACAAVVDGNRIMDQHMGANLCALTFDDGPSRYTPALLDALAEYGIKATFFMLGKNVQLFPEIVRRIQAEGHEIGNHSWSHPNLRTLSLEKLREQLCNTDRALRDLGVTPLYMRPPYGAFDDRVVEVANELGIDIVLWSLDSYDWKRLPSDYAKLRSTRGTVYDDGALRGIFLFHDIHKATVDDLPRIIANLRAGGCEKFVTVNEYMTSIMDPEPPLLMTRHDTGKTPAVASAPVAPPPPAYASDDSDMPLARCSRPWNYVETKPAEPLLLDDAQAAARHIIVSKVESNIN